jgi:hypothetical protein
LYVFNQDCVLFLQASAQRFPVVQAKFNAVYNTVTRSNNNEWLRRKLFEGTLQLSSVCQSTPPASAF